MNRMEDVAKLLGVELGERFTVEFGNGICVNDHFINEDGLNRGTCNSYTQVLSELLIGNFKVVKQPWTPKEGERYCEDDTVRIETFGGMVLIGDISDIDLSRIELRMDCGDSVGEIEIAECDIKKIEKW